METEIYQTLKDWIKHISTPMKDIGGMPVCPYAKETKYQVISVKDNDINPPSWFFELIIYVFPNDITIRDLKLTAEKYNKIFPELIFLPDHKNHTTYINGIRTNNGKHNLLLCQYRRELENARNKLRKTNYYQYWTEEYLKEILQT